MLDFILNNAPEKFLHEAQKLKEKSPKELDEIILASNGSIGLAYEFLDYEKRSAILKKRELIRNFVETALNAQGNTALIDVVSSFSQKRDELSEQIEAVKIALRDLLILKKSETAPLCFFSDREEALELSSIRSASYLLKFLAACENATAALARNANIKLTTTILLTSI